MAYSVLWKPVVKDQLAEIWIKAPDRRRVTAAANAIDEMLQTSPLDEGESRTGSERILIVAPLVVVFEVDQQNSRVWVLAVRHLPTRL